MPQFIITSKGYQLLQVGAGRAADLLQVASSIAEDGKVSQDELVEELKVSRGVSRGVAEEVLEGLVQLGLIRPTNSLPLQRYHRLSHPRRGGV